MTFRLVNLDSRCFGDAIERVPVNDGSPTPLSDSHQSDITSSHIDNPISCETKEKFRGTGELRFLLLLRDHPVADVSTIHLNSQKLESPATLL